MRCGVQELPADRKLDDFMEEIMNNRNKLGLVGFLLLWPAYAHANDCMFSEASFGVVSVLFFASQTILLKVISGMNFVTVMIIRQIPFVVMIIIALSVSKKMRNMLKYDLAKVNKKDFSLVLSADTLGLVGMIFLYIAIQLGPVSLVGLIEGSQIIITMIFSVFLTLFFPKIIKEDISRNSLLIKASAVMIMFMGVFLLS